MKLQSEFSREFLKTIFAHLPPLASAAWCGPHPPLYSSGTNAGQSRYFPSMVDGKEDSLSASHTAYHHIWHKCLKWHYCVNFTAT